MTLGCRIYGLGFRTQGLGSMALGVGFGVEGSDLIAVMTQKLEGMSLRFILTLLKGISR